MNYKINKEWRVELEVNLSRLCRYLYKYKQERSQV